jgi:hypothetical protein
MASVFRVNLGGEGEVPGILNQQPPFALLPSWRSQTGQTVAELQAAGISIIIAPNDQLPLAAGSVDEVITNSVPIDTNVPGYGPGVQSSEIWSILKSGGRWVHDGTVMYVKP